MVHYLVTQVEGGLDPHKGHVESAADERLSEVRRIVARDRDLDVLQLVTQHMHGPRQPVHLMTGLEADGERLLLRLRCFARRLDRGIDLYQRQAGVVEKGLASSGELDAMNAARQQLGPNLVLQFANLPAE